MLELIEMLKWVGSNVRVEIDIVAPHLVMRMNTARPQFSIQVTLSASC